MVILQVCGYAAVYGGNFIASLIALAKDMKEKGHETEFLFPEQARDKDWCIELSQHWKVHFAPLNRFSIKTYFQIKEAMKSADIIHSHFELYDMLVVLAAKSNQKIFWHLHDSIIENVDFVHMWINRIQYRYFGRKVLLISTNKYYAEQLTKLGFKRYNIRVVENCINFERLHYSKKDKKYDFLIFGGFYHIKGLDVVLEACRLIKDKYKFKLGIVGYDKTWEWIDENYKDLYDVIETIKPQENINDLYNSSEVFISASRHETFSYALLEALYLKKPAIISRIEGTKWAERYPTVKVFESENALDLGQAMAQYLSGNFWYKEEEPEKVVEEVKARHNIGEWVESIERIYFYE